MLLPSGTIMTLKTILSWNVNGIRSVHKKGFLDWLTKEKPDVICLQEIKAGIDQVPADLKNIPGYHCFFNPAKRPGYSGVATLTLEKPISVREGFGIPEFDCEGRTLITEFSKFILINVYFPSGTSGPERLAFKMRFYDAFLDFCQNFRKTAKKPIVICGDVNTAHREIDLKNPKENAKNSGFLPEERAWIDKLISHGYVDTYRHLNPDKVEYSWWTHRFQARARNIGWRLDYHFVTQDFVGSVKESFVLGKVPGSDHAPVGIRLEL